ncbi:hypothetical protein EV363DRAFT_662256 [Boletus edulis]|nr:hypothetical protein EV363DRAFT_662256 [Boletus edulis]
MILSPLRNVSHYRSPVDTQSTHPCSSTVGSSGTPRVSYRFLPISLFIRQFPALVLSCGLFSWGSWYPRYVRRRPANGVLLSAMVCITWSSYWSWLLAQDTRVFRHPRGLYLGPSSIDIHTSLAGGFYVPASHLFPFLIYFLTSMCQYHRLISALHAFATSHHASYFGSREIVQKESTRPHTLKQIIIHSSLGSAMCIR